MSTQDTSIQQSALVTPIDGLSLPSANLVGQLTQFSTPNTAPVYRATVNQASGPFLADTTENIQLFTDIFNSGKQLENTINGVVQDDTLETFLYSTLGIARTVDVEAICAYIDEQTYAYGGKTYEWFVSAAALAEIDAAGVRTSYLRTKYGARYIGNYDAIKGQWVQLLAIINAIDFGNSSTTKDGTCFGKPGDQKKKNWYWADKCGSLANGGIDLHTISENTACRDNATAADIASGYMIFSEPRTLYNLAISLDEKLTGITGLDASSPPSTLSIPLPVTDVNIQSVFVSASDANEFSSRSVDVRVNPDSIQVGPSDPTRLIKVFNTKKFNFTDDTVALSARSPTVLQSLNLIDRKAEKNFALADSVESAVWSTGVGDWRNSQSDDPNITAQLSAAGYTESGSQALRRLNLIPVTSGDKIQVLSADSAGDPILVVDESAQVNLLEATWTAWQNIAKLNTNMYGISATNMPELSSTALLAELSGNSVIENLNLLYNMYLTGGDAGSETGIDFTPVIDILSGDIGTNRTDIDTLKEAISALTQTESLSSVISSLTGLDTVTILDQLSGLTQSLSSLSALSADITDLETINTTLYDLDIPNLSACCESNKDAIDILQLTLDNINTTELSGIAEMIQAIDIDTYVARLSSVEQQITNLGDIQNYITQITDNTINIETVNTELSALTGTMQDQIDNLTGLVSNLDMDSLSSAVDSINNITNVNVLLEQLSGDTRINDLSSCCNQNADAIANIDTQLTQNTANIINNTTSIEQISANAGGTPDGVVLTTTNQTITGDKTFKSTMTVQASSYFEDCMTVGDTDQPIVFNVYSVDGQTRVNIKNLPTITQINDLSPGDLYIRTVDGHDLLAVKQQTGS